MGLEDEYRTPGQYVAVLRDSRGWTNKVLAVVADVDEATISKLVNGKKTLDAELALVLAEVFEVPAEDLLGLQKTYDLALAKTRRRPDPARAKRAQLFGSLPVAEMIKRGWLGDVTTIKELPRVEAALAQFFGAADVSEIAVLPHAAKKTDQFAGATPTQIAWLYRVRQIAREMVVGSYSGGSIERALAELGKMRIAVEATRHVPRVLEEAGIRFVVVESLPSAKMDGVCFWLSDSEPVVGMSLRHDRVDNFWFVLRHELEHVRQGHGRTTAMLDAELEGERAGVGEGVAEEERTANAAAAEFCVPQKLLREFIVRKEPFFAERDIVALARMLSVHPGLVAGQLQHQTKRYDRFRAHQSKVRSFLTPSAMADGWGDVVPVERGATDGN